METNELQVAMAITRVTADMATTKAAMGAMTNMAMADMVDMTSMAMVVAMASGTMEGVMIKTMAMEVVHMVVSFFFLN